MTQAEPIICKPLGTLPLADVPAFPPAAAAALERDHAIRTLADLQPHVEGQGDADGAVRKAFVVLGVRKEHLDQATWSLLRHLNPGGEPEKPKKRARASQKRSASERSDSAADIRMCQDCLRVGGVHEGDCSLAIECPTCKAFAGVKCCIRRKRSDKPHKERIAIPPANPNAPPGGFWTKAPCPKHAGRFNLECPACNSKNATYHPPENPAPQPGSAADFDESTPPPRIRPIGDAVRRYVKLPRGESAVQTYWDWDKAGRIPAGSVLCEFIGTEMGTRSGYRVAATPWPPPLGEPGEEVPLEKLDGWYCRVSIDQRGSNNHLVMSREGT